MSKANELYRKAMEDMEESYDDKDFVDTYDYEEENKEDDESDRSFGRACLSCESPGTLCSRAFFIQDASPFVAYPLKMVFATTNMKGGAVP